MNIEHMLDVEDRHKLLEKNMMVLHIGCIVDIIFGRNILCHLKLI